MTLHKRGLPNIYVVMTPCLGHGDSTVQIIQQHSMEDPGNCVNLYP